MNCAFSSAEAVKSCVDLVFPWVSVLLGVVGLGVLLFQLGSTVAIAFVMRSAKRLEKDVQDAKAKEQEATSKYREIMTTFSGPLQQFQQQVVAEQKARERADSAEQKLVDLQQRFEALRAAPSATSTEAAKSLTQAEGRAKEFEDKLAYARRTALSSFEAFWSRSVGRDTAALRERRKSSIPIILFANQKGGVGKTTLSGNLAAYFAHKAGERVLAIDLDYQGSMTIMMERQSGATDEQFRSAVDLLFQRELPTDWQAVVVKQINARLRYVSCYYSFEQLERALEYSWLLGDSSDDLRFRLARCLMSDEIQTSYDRVIIDAPPRLTTGFVNGFCAATHVFVPTIVDAISLNAVGNFAEQFRKLSEAVNADVKLGGVIGIRTTNVQDHALPGTLQSLADSADVAIRKSLHTKENYFIRDAVLRNYPSMAAAAEQGIPYFKEESARPMFDNLGRRIGQLAPRRGK